MRKNSVVFKQDDLAFMAEFLGALRFNGYDFEVFQNEARHYIVEVL